MDRRLIGVALAALSVGLAGATVTVTQPNRLLEFEREVAPFVVLDAAGRPYDLPFLGGLDVPRPQFVDIDADGDHDLFLQEYSNAIRFFENRGSAAEPRFEWRTEKYEGLDIGEWFRFVDLDDDGDFDLLAEQPFSNIRLYRNTGSRTRATFAVAESLKDVDGQPMFLDRQNIPAIVDIDCDKRLDFFIGRVEGHVARYEADAPGSDRFAFIEERFEGIEIIGRSGGPPSLRSTFLSFGATPSTRHGANALAFADFDGDKDADLFWGDFFEAGVLLIENIGRTCSTPSFQVEPVQLPYADATQTSGYNIPAPVDLDFDGDLDFLMGVVGGSFNPVATAADNFYYWRRTAPNRLELQTRRFLNGIDLGSDTVPAAADLDADGDIDLVIGSKTDPNAADAGRLTFFYNEGQRGKPAFRQGASMKLVDAFHLAPALGDIDADGDVDLFVGTWNQDIKFFRNRGTAREARWVEEAAGAIKPPRVSMATLTLADLDADKDLDVLVGQATGTITFYRNDGSPSVPKFSLIEERLGELRPGRRSAPAIADITGDGLPDLVVGREEPGAVVYRNAGTRASARFVEAGALPLLPLSSPAVADIDGDGVVDVVSGTVSGGVLFLRGIKKTSGVF